METLTGAQPPATGARAAALSVWRGAGSCHLPAVVLPAFTEAREPVQGTAGLGQRARELRGDVATMMTPGDDAGQEGPDLFL